MTQDTSTPKPDPELSKVIGHTESGLDIPFACLLWARRGWESRHSSAVCMTIISQHARYCSLPRLLAACNGDPTITNAVTLTGCPIVQVLNNSSTTTLTHYSRSHGRRVPSILWVPRPLYRSPTSTPAQNVPFHRLSSISPTRVYLARAADARDAETGWGTRECGR